MPLATASVVLQSYTLDLMLLGLNVFGASNRFVAKDILTVQNNAAVYDKSIILKSNSSTGTYLRAGTGISFSDVNYRNQVVVAEDITVTGSSGSVTSVKVEPLLKPLSSGVTGTVLAPVRMILNSVDTTNNIDTWRFVDSMITIEGLSPFTRAVISIVNPVAGSSPIMIPQNANLDFGSLTPINPDVVFLNPTSSSVIYFNGSPNTLNISAGSQASYLTGSIPLCGIQTMDLSNQDTQIDITTFQSGLGTDSNTVRYSRSYSISGISLSGDEALEKIVKPAAGLKSISNGKEVYAIATFPDGERIEGVAVINNLNLPTNQNEVKKYSFTLTFLGKNFNWDSPII